MARIRYPVLASLGGMYVSLWSMESPPGKPLDPFSGDPGGAAVVAGAAPDDGLPAVGASSDRGAPSGAGERPGMVARRREVEGLLEAARIGGPEAAEALRARVSVLRGDTALPAGFRAEIAGRYEFALAVRRRGTAAERMDAIERAARGLIREFPDQPQGYESWLNVARYLDDRRHQAIVRELAGSAAPAAVQESARALVRRWELAGRSVRPLLAHLPALDAALPTVIHTWSVSGARTHWDTLGALDPARVNLIALGTDGDAPAVREAAGKIGVPGTLCFSPAALDLLATREAGVICLIDARGRIVHPRGEHDLTAKLADLGLSP